MCRAKHVGLTHVLVCTSHLNSQFILLLINLISHLIKSQPSGQCLNSRCISEMFSAFVSKLTAFQLNFFRWFVEFNKTFYFFAGQVNERCFASPNSS